MPPSGLHTGMRLNEICRLHTEDAVLIDALRRSPVVELYGCWAGEYAGKTEGEREVHPDDIVSGRFFFREPVLYRLRAKAPNRT